MNKAAFELHQATESLYTAILLVFSGYKPKDHDLAKIGIKVEVYYPEQRNIFPLETEEQNQCFKLLCEAYVGARYDKNYVITEEQLLYLIERVELLKATTQEICLEKLREE